MLAMTLLNRFLYQLNRLRLVQYNSGDDAGDPSGEAHTLLFVMEGRGDIHIDGESHPLEVGRVYCAAPGHLLQFRNVPEHSLVRAYRIEFERFGLMEHSSVHRLFRKPGFHLDSGEIRVAEPNRAMALAEEMMSLGIEEANLLENRFRQLLEELLGRKSGHADVRTTTKIQEAILYMKEYYAGKITRDLMAGMLKLNPEYFSVLFKKEMGVGFSEYLNRLRVEKAKELLFLSTRGVHEIALEVGYTDGFYFSRKFKELAGETPTAFARREKRIIALQHLGHLLALDVKPVGASPTYLTRWGIANERMTDIAWISEQFRLEDIAALRPDLIIAHHLIDDEQLERLSSIARTVVVPYNKSSPLTLFSLISELLGKKKEASIFLERFNRKAEQARRRLAGAICANETVAYYEIWRDRIWLMSEANGRGVANLYHALGLKPPAALKKDVLDPGIPLSISIEELPGYAADHMLIGVYRSEQEAASDSGWFERLQQSKEWRTLPAVIHGRVHVVDLHALAPSDMLSLYYQLDLQVECLLAAIK
ncbi:HTH-type transcriptional activator RhaR [Paenibacillus plantiphilus]|uniref:HTH-type transcriptional activator RhaR n=1 Tax=Paenibacillus plantiphilus TaxID=2905650 RepID=A0ABN8GSY1_9BACL|nr:helix-turn-helix domain-containing protein [Paenibacillus plantiphilus]CAH1214942.1 HTH-type transcriptional activator RhaR [Paenibacillus plantiphilus]